MTLYLLFQKLKCGEMTFDELEAEARVRIRTDELSVDECEHAIDVTRRFLKMADAVKLAGAALEKQKARRLVEAMKIARAEILKKRLPNAI